MDKKSKRNIKYQNIISQFFIAWLIFFSGYSHLSAQENKIIVIPEPQNVTYFDELFVINQDTKIILGKGANELDSFTIHALNQHIQEMAGFPLSVIHEDSVTSRSKMIFFGNLDSSDLARKFAKNYDITATVKIGNEGYCLQSSDSLLVVVANTSPGLFYGGMTLKQLIHKKDEQLQVPGLTIYDWPDFPFRGISLDLSNGHVPDNKNFKKLMRFMSQYKMNTIMLYLGNNFQYENLPRIAKGRVVLSRSDISELDEFAKNHHIRIIPIIETLTNMVELLTMPEYIDLAQYPGASTIAPLNENANQLVDEMLIEIINAFQSPYLHIGGAGSHQIDWSAGKSEFDERDLLSVLSGYFNRIVATAKKYNKQVMMNADIFLSLPSLIYQLPEDILYVHASTNCKNNESEKRIIEQSGRKYLISATLSDTQSIFPDYFSTLPAIKKVAKSGYKTGASGIIAVSWNRESSLTFQALNYYGYAYAAECSWSSGSALTSAFNDKYFKQYYGIKSYELEIIQNLLTDITELAPWQEIWRHPLLFSPEFFQQSLKANYKLKTRMHAVLRLIESISKRLLKNKEQLDFLKFAAEQAAWYTKKNDVMIEIDRFNKNLQNAPTTAEVEKIIASSFELVEDLNQIEENVQLLWMRSYRAEKIPDILDLYGRQVDYWQEIIGHFQTGQFDYDPILNSSWIYHPNKSDFEQSTSHAFFRKTFDVPPGFRNAYLQAIADSYIKVYLNGGYLGDVVFVDKNAFNLSGENAVFWDISSIIRPGKNVIAVEAWNYQPGHSAGLNIYGEIEYEFGRTLELQSDAYWKTSTIEMQNWQNLGFYDLQWLNAEPHPRNLIIIKPNFRIARTSIIERK